MPHHFKISGKQNAPTAQWTEASRGQSTGSLLSGRSSRHALHDVLYVAHPGFGMGFWHTCLKVGMISHGCACRSRLCRLPAGTLLNTRSLRRQRLYTSVDSAAHTEPLHHGIYKRDKFATCCRLNSSSHIAVYLAQRNGKYERYRSWKYDGLSGERELTVR